MADDYEHNLGDEATEREALSEFQDFYLHWLERYAPEAHSMLIISRDDGTTTIFSNGESNHNKLTMLDWARDAVLNPDRCGQVPVRREQ